MTEAPAPLVTVRLLEMPLDVYARSTQHWDELMREFALISLDAERADRHTTRPLPERLNGLVDELSHDFAAFTADTEAERDDALARGELSIDLSYQVPHQAADGARRLGVLLDEVDEFCRSGQHLITLASPPETLAFRRWYLDEFIEQVENHKQPQAWPAYVGHRHADEAWTRG